MSEYIIALDQGTTSSRAIIFNNSANIVSKAQIPFRQIYPNPGWVEHDPIEILKSQLDALNNAFIKSGVAARDIAGIGITNQRETTVVWDKNTGKPVYNAIVWQCRRTAPDCVELEKLKIGNLLREKTGLLVDAYFSGTKIKWILDNVPEARKQAEKGDLLFGTIDTWLIWNLTGGKTHITDYSNAARTMIFDINKLQWDGELCRILGIPMQMLPEPVPNSKVYGHLDGKKCGLPDLDGIPICGSAGDQQAALFGQACFNPGDAKNTYGTGCFTLMNIGNKPVLSSNNLITTLAWSLGGEPVYALEGSVFNAGSTIQWIRDELGIISSSHECDELAEQVADSGGVYIVPAFTGLGAPYWDMYARGTITGLTRGSNKCHIARAVLDSIAYQVTDLINAMSADSVYPLTELRVDGGASVSNIMMQFQAELLGIPVNRPAQIETTALGAAYLAGLSAGLWKDTEQIARLRKADKIFNAAGSPSERTCLLDNWHRAVERASGWIES